MPLVQREDVMAPMAVGEGSTVAETGERLVDALGKIPLTTVEQRQLRRRRLLLDHEPNSLADEVSLTATLGLRRALQRPLEVLRQPRDDRG